MIHFAAFAYIGESNENPSAYYRNNIGGTAALLDAMRDCGVEKIMFSSSCAVYGTPERVPIVEQSPCAPVNPYGVTKWMCERMLKECAAAFPLSFMALRYFNAVGADPGREIGECHVPETHAIPLLLTAAAGESEGFAIFGDDYPTQDGTCVRDYVHVSDLADAHVAALRALLGGAESAAFNIGTGRGWSVHELINCVHRTTNRDVPTRIGPRRLGDPSILVTDAAYARKRRGWRPQYADIAIQVLHAWTWRQGTGQTWKRMQTDRSGRSHTRGKRSGAESIYQAIIIVIVA